MRAARCAALAALAPSAAGHGYVVSPPPRAAGPTATTPGISGDITGAAGSCASGVCFWFSQSCTIGCPKCLGSNSTGVKAGQCPGQQGTATLPDYARTRWYDTRTIGNPYQKECGFAPWCAPGSAPIMNPCGVAGGDVISGVPGNGGNPPPGHTQGEDGRKLPELQGPKTVWQAGSVQEIQWAIIANHAGGYQYRLCKKSGEETEECFQQNPMEFSGDEQWIQYCQSEALYPPYSTTGPFPKCDLTNRTAIKAVKVSTGTVPAGSTWMRSPIPACRATGDGSFAFKCGPGAGTQPDDFQFPPAGPDLARPGFLLGGFGASSCYGIPDGCGFNKQKVLDHMFNFNIVDKVVVPQVPPGEYVMSFRWDCEQTPQIWSTCSDVTITA